MDTAALRNARWGMKDTKQVLEKTFRLFALSVSWTNQWYHDIVIYGDELTLAMFEGIPVETVLIDNPVPPDVWAMTKINTIRHQIGSYVHIDADFVMRKPIELSTEQVMFDRYETENFHHHYTPWLSMFRQIRQNDTIKWWQPSDMWCVNCGIISVGNSAMFREVLKSVDETLLLYRQSQKSLGYKFLQNKLDPNAVIEQWGIRLGLEKLGIKPKFLTSGMTQKAQRSWEQRHGYYHYYGYSKYDDINQRKFDDELRSLFPSVHKQLEINLNKYIR